MLTAPPDAPATSQQRAAPPHSRFRALLAGLLISAISVCFMVLLIEVVLHVIDYPPEQTDHQRLFVEYDPVRGWRNIPGARGRYVTEEYDVELRYNSRGIRGPEHAYEKPPGTFRIVIVGDSYVEGYAVGLQQRVSEVLQRLLTENGGPRKAEVIALGTAGYSSDQELLWLEQEGLRYHPDLVVTMFYANDVWYNIQSVYWRGGKPLFRLRGDSLELTNVPVPPLRFEERRQRHSLRDFIEKHSKLYWIAAGALKQQPRLYAMAVRAGLAEVPPEMVLQAGDKVPVPAEFNVYRTVETPDVALAWRTTEAILARMRRSTEQQGGRFIAFLVPLRSEIYTQEATVRGATMTAAAGWNANAVAQHFHRICAREQLICIDPTERFRDEARRLPPDQRLYFSFDWHWNARGHTLAAHILKDAIQSQ